MLVKTQDGAEIDVDLDAHADSIKEHFAGKGLAWKTQKEIDAEIESHKGQASKEAHSAWENIGAEVFGEKRPDGKKGLDWFKEKGTDLAEKAKKAAEQPKPETPKVSDEVEKARFTALENELKSLKEATANKEKAAGEKALNAGIKSAIRQIKVDGEGQEADDKRQSLEVLIRQGFDWKLDDESGDLVPYKGTEVQINPKTTKPFTMNELVELKYPYMLAKPEPSTPPVTGTGTKQAQLERAKSGDEGIRAASEADIRDEARKRGFIAGSDESKKFIAASMELSGLKR